MTIEELVEVTHIAKSKWERKFKKTQDDYLNMTGKEVKRVGSMAKGYDYTIDFVGKPENMFKMPKQEVRKLSLSSFQFLSFEHVLFLGVIFTPTQAFHGNSKQFLEYVGIDPEDRYIEKVIPVLKVLSDNGFVDFVWDDQYQDYFTVGIKEGKNREIGITPEKIDQCRQIAAENHLEGYKGWNDVLRTWVIIEFLSQNTGEDYYITNREICDATGLDEHRVIQIKKALVNSEKMVSNKGFRVNKDGQIRSIGVHYKFNALTDGGIITSA